MSKESPTPVRVKDKNARKNIIATIDAIEAEDFKKAETILQKEIDRRISARFKKFQEEDAPKAK